MTSLPINLIPAEILNRFGERQIVLLCNDQLGDAVFGTTTFDPASLREIEGLEALPELRRQEGVYSITCTIMRLDSVMIDKATTEFANRAQIIDELKSLLEREGEVNVVYVVTHFNYRPLEELTVFIGGDCYRTGKEIKDFESVLTRTKDLAGAMVRKTVIVFPDIDALHGGKKGEWIIVDKAGKKLEGLSDEAIVALGTFIIATGIGFLNRYKEKTATEKGIYQSFPPRNYIRPDTASPDVLSGTYWSLMCDVWRKRGLDMSLVTCLPPHMGGPLVTSAHPTGYGVVATALKLVEHFFVVGERPQVRFLLEGLGGVGQATVEALIKEKKIAPDRITAFDKDRAKCEDVHRAYGIETRPSTAEAFYPSLDPSQRYDVWINNGDGDNTLPGHVQKLLDCGVRLFCGAANNFLKITDRRDSLERIFDAGGWAWPDEAASGGGWTLAVVDVLTRAKGERSDTEEARRRILDTIISRNERLVDAVVQDVTTNGTANGQALFKKVEQIIDDRVRTTLNMKFTPAEIMEKAEVTKWSLS